jgi:hypothetical protein
MSALGVLRYWFLYGNHDANNHVIDTPPISVGKGANAYERGQQAALKRGKWYRRAIHSSL